MDIVEISGISLTILGVIVTGAAALHQYQKNKKLENRLERKEDLREFADLLKEINGYMMGFRDGLANFVHGTSVWHDARDFSKEYLSRKQLDEDPEIHLSIFQYREGGKRVSVDDPEEFIRTIKMHESATISLELEDIIEESGDQTFIHLDKSFQRP